MDPEPIAAGIDAGRRRFTEHGVAAHFCLVGLDGSEDVDATVTTTLGARSWQVVVIGGGVRGEVALLERVVNHVRVHAPQAAIAFSESPPETYDAAARWLGRAS